MRIQSPLSGRWLPLVNGRVIALCAVGAAIAATFGALGALGVVTQMQALIGAFSACVLPVVAFTRMGELELGTDGLRLTWMGRERFVPLVDITGAAIVVHIRGADQASVPRYAVEITTTCHGTIRLTPGLRSTTPFEGRAFCELIERQLADLEHRPAASEAARFVRAGRSAADWLATLRTVSLGDDAHLRVAPVTVEQAWEVVDDPRVPPDARAAAAVAVALATPADDTRTRLLVVAGTTVSPALRSAFEQAARGTEADIAAALERLGGSRPASLA